MKFVLDRIKPSSDERKRVEKLAKEIIQKIKVKDAKAVLGGSGAKDTWLRGSHDVDIYVKFNYNKYKDKSEKLANYLEKGLKKFKYEKLHGSRDYFQIKKDGFTFEIVPILDIKKDTDAKNITDISILHVNYIAKHKKLVDEIRLMKAFAKANGVYGAESYIRGFSGYVCELLVINYGSFNKLIRSAAKWKPKVIIGDKKKAMRLNKSKTESPLILLDPVQSDRNAAAALSREKFDLFVKKAKLYLGNPSEEFFIKKEVDVIGLSKRGNLVILEVKPNKGKEDVIGAKLLKAFEYIKTKITKEGFNLVFSEWEWEDKAKFYYLVKSEKLNDYKEFNGPMINDKVNVQRFRKKHKNQKFFTKKGFIFVRVKRDYKDINGFISKLIKKDETLKQWVNNISN